MTENNPFISETSQNEDAVASDAELTEPESEAEGPEEIHNRESLARVMAQEFATKLTHDAFFNLQFTSDSAEIARVKKLAATHQISDAKAEQLLAAPSTRSTLAMIGDHADDLREYVGTEPKDINDFLMNDFLDREVRRLNNATLGK